MADGNKRERRNRSWINVNKHDEVRTWAKALGVTEAELRKAVATAGASAVAVLGYIGRNH